MGPIELTRSRRVLAEVASLVATNEAGGLDFRGSTAGKTGVEVHHAVHAGSILSGTNRLFRLSVNAESN